MLLPKAILFDLDDTIISFSGSSEACWREVCAIYSARVDGLPQEGLLEAILKSAQWYWGDVNRHKRGRLDLKQARREVVTGAFRSLNIDDPTLVNEIADAFTTRRETSISLFPGAIETLASLRNQGVKLGLITNGSSEDQRRKINGFGIGPYFDCIFIEGETGIGKPEIEVYQKALEQLGVRPEETWMVGDNLEWDIEAPQKLGIMGIWVDFNGKGLLADSPIQPDRIIRSITELTEPGH